MAKTQHPKHFLASKWTNTIKHRALDAFERKYPARFDFTYSKHDTWEQAHATIIERRTNEIAELERKLRNAKLRLKAAQKMKPPNQK